MAAILDIRPAISIHASEAPSLVVDAVIVEAARQFCRETLAVRADHANIALAAADSTYPLTAPVGTELLDVVYAKVDGSEPLTKTTPRLMAQGDAAWETATGEPTHFYLDGDTLVVWPTPTAAATLRVRMALMPEIAASTLPDALTRHYEAALRSGALYRLLDMPRKPWTDKNEAKFHGGVFMNEIALAKHKAANEHQSGVARKTGYGGI